MANPEAGCARRAADGMVQPALLAASAVAWRGSRAAFHLGGREGDRSTVFRIVRAMDAGPILAQSTVESERMKRRVSC